jgi:hypothetical protein
MPDLNSLLIYCGLIALAYVALMLIRAQRAALGILIGAWVTILFGPGALTSLCLFALVAYLIGTFSFRFCRLEWDAPPPVTLATGYAIILGAMQIFVLLGCATRGIIVTLALGVTIAGRKSLITVAQQLKIWFSKRLSVIGSDWLALPVLVIGAVQLVYASFDESHSDALTLHLRVAHQVALTGTWNFDAATMNAATMPKGASWLFAIHYVLAGEPAARLFNFFASIVTFWIVLEEVGRRVDMRAGVLAATLFLSAPITFWCVWIMFQDAVFTLFSTAAIVTLTNIWNRPTPNGSLIVALFLAACAATKTQGLLIMGPIGLVLLIRLIWTNDLSNVVAAIAAMALPIALIGSVPYTESTYYTGNPLFPFYNAIFKSPFFPSENFVDDRWTGKASPFLLFDLTFETSHFMESFDGGFGISHFVLVPSILIALLLMGRRSVFLLPAACAAIIFIIMAFFTQYARYLYPTFPLLSIAAGALWQRAALEGGRAVVTGVAIGLVAVNVYMYRSLHNGYYFYPPNPLKAQPKPQPAYPGERTLNSIVNATFGQSARVLYLERAFGAGLDGTALYLAPHLGSQLLRDSRSVTDVQSLEQFLRKYHITHVMSDEGITPTVLPMFQQYLPMVAHIVAGVGPVKLWQIEPGR